MSYTYKTPLGDKLTVSAVDDGPGCVVLQIVSAMGTSSVPLPIELHDVECVLNEIREHAIAASDVVALQRALARGATRSERERG